ncbi:hypothetical protein Sjap_022969 [Stephania japonica]|uniref:Srp40 C-terminal domain-containing protein n=1 Tax=Stephania japonica TaxID=461633 RepID=A0AAP0EVA7_9MAGN
MFDTSLAFVPRQVTLAKSTIATPKMAKPKHAEIEQSDEPLIAKSTKKDKKKKSKKNATDDLSPILLSIAAFLKQHGFSKTVAALQSEASIEEIGDGHNVCEMDLESYYKHLKTSQFDQKADLHVGEKLDVQVFDTSSKEKDKKKKKSNSIDSENVECDCMETLPLEEENMKPKDAKRKKHKKPSETLDGDVRGRNPEDIEVVMKRISENSESSKLATENGNGENHLDYNHHKSKSKDKKQKKKHSSECSGGEEDVEKHSSEKEGSATLEEPAVGGERKSSKKRKKAASEDDELQPSGKIKSKKAKQGEVGGSVEGEGNNKSNSVPEVGNADSKKRKIENGGYSIESQGLPLVKDLNGLSNVKDSADEFIKENSINKGLENSGPVTSATQKSTKNQQNGSAEPKAGTPFQRVKVDQVQFADDRLQDNSYWAKDGAETGYGAKAQEVLGQVRGRDFRHEKTKKKRGSYRGGQIDQQSHSIKFQYSDDE